MPTRGSYSVASIHTLPLDVISQAATFSSALASLVGAPQLLYALAKDAILPLGYFTTTHRRVGLKYERVDMVAHRAKQTEAKALAKAHREGGAAASVGAHGVDVYAPEAHTAAAAGTARGGKKLGGPKFVTVHEDGSEKEAAEADPVRGYFVTYFITVACVLIGSLNAVAPLISMFFMPVFFLRPNHQSGPTYCLLLA